MTYLEVLTLITPSLNRISRPDSTGHIQLQSKHHVELERYSFRMLECA